MHTGHFIASRCAAIVLEETNVAPQCSRCNLYGSGEQRKFQIWMDYTFGPDEIDRLQSLKNGPVRQFTRDELVDLKLGYMERNRAAQKVMRDA